MRVAAIAGGKEKAMKKMGPNERLLREMRENKFAKAKKRSNVVKLQTKPIGAPRVKKGRR
jgi:hypothetical protein